MDKILKIFIFVCFFAVLNGGYAGHTQAQPAFFDMTKIEKIPTYHEELPEEQFLATTDSYEETPKGDKYLAYRVRLPRGWSQMQVSSSRAYKSDEIEEAGLSRRMLGEVARYFGPGRIEALTRFDIQALSLEHDVTAKNWFMHEMLARGYTLEGLKEISDRRIEVLYVVVEKDVSYVVRSVAEINGPRMIIASYAIPEKFWMQERAYQERVIESFEFVSPEVSRIEMVRTHTFLDLLSFDYPASWRLIAPAVYSIDGMEAKLINSRDDVTLAGEMSLSVLSSDFEGGVSEEIEYLKEDIRLRGLDFGDLIEIVSEEYDIPDFLYYAHVEIYELHNVEGAVMGHEYWVAVMEEDRYFYVLTMLSPSREVEFYTWARNKEAFKTVIESFKL